MNIIEIFVRSIIDFLPKIPWTALGLLTGWVIIKIIVFFVKRALRLGKFPKDVVGIIITITKFVLWTVLFVIVAEQLGLGSFAIAISGSAAVAAFFLSASVGPTLSNIFAGLFLASDPDIAVGMTISTNDGKTVGTIKGIDMRKVRIIDANGKMHILPNSVVENNEWVIVSRKGDK